MKLIPFVAAMSLAALLTACDRPNTTTSTTARTNTATAPAPSSSSVTTTAGTGAPNAPATTTVAPGPAGDATGAVSETMTTGKIKAAIAADSGLRDSDISVTTNNGVVTLTGTAKSQDQVSLATNLAQRQDGVTRVENNISVR